MINEHCSRTKRLDELANNEERLYQVLTAQDHERPGLIQAAARTALGIATDTMITDIEAPLRHDVLYLMRAIRDNIPSETQERNNRRYILHAQLVAKSINGSKDEV